MNDADRKAFSEWANKDFYADLADIEETWDGQMYRDSAHHMAWCAWQKRGEWRDSQVGEPVAYLVDPGAGSARDKLIFPWQLCSTILTTKLDDRGGSVTPLYAQPNPPTAQINQQLTALLEKSLHWLDGLCDAGPLGQQYPSDELTQFVDDIRAALAATQMRGDA